MATTVGAREPVAGRPAGARRSIHLRAWSRRLTATGAVLVLAAGTTVGGSAPRANATGCGANPIVCENAEAGSPSQDWDINRAGDASIQGFATDISVNVGQRIDFKVTSPHAYTVDIYRIGWYGGAGARKITSVTPSATLPQTQPDCVTDPSTQIYDCGNWAVSASWTVPATAVSGVYFALLTRTDTGGASHITFVVRDDSSTSAVLFKTSDATWQAYNMYGGANFYGGTDGRAYKLSYNRPFGTRGDNSGRDFLFSNEYPMIGFLERNGYDVSYTTDIDSDRRGGLIKNHKVFVSVGHDEYWSGPERANVEAARDAGVNLAFFSGNEVYWKTRLEASEDGTATPNRTLVCYKETWANAKIDPSPEWTGTWRDPRFSPPANGGRPENNLTGTQYFSNFDDFAIQVPPEQGRYRLWRNTDVATATQPVNLAPHTVGYESDEDVDNGFRPAGLIWLSTTTGATPQYLRDFGNTVTAGTTTHHMTLYRAASGALVFSAGTIQWAWGLSNDHDGTVSPPDTRMQQATVNLLADMGVQAATLMTGLVAATASTDTQAPTATITAPATLSSLPSGAAVTVQGTAIDAGGGQVAAVEVSTDGGTTWHPATGTTSWSYSFVASGATEQVVEARAVDDSANIQSVPATIQLNVSGPYSIFGARTPVAPSVSDAVAVELGVKFVPQDNGYVTGIRFYKGTGNTGTHTGTLWSSTGTNLATGAFTSETASGWQTLTFDHPIPVSASTTYIASYYAPNGHYAADPFTFSYGSYSAPPLKATRSLGTDLNGLFRYGGGFPTDSYQDTNYYVDVTFLDSTVGPPTVLATGPTADAVDVPVSVQTSAAFSTALDPNSIRFTLTDSAGAAVAGSTSYDDPSKTATFTPASALHPGERYTATVQAGNPTGALMQSATTWSFTTDPYTSVTTLFPTDAVPAVSAVDDPNGVELGMRFVPSVSGSVIGARFYKGAGNNGTHTGSLYAADGTLLARLTFSGETGSGWQSARFATPVHVTAGTTYVVSYFAPNGHYAANNGFFTAAYTSSPLRAPAGSNGVYRYGADAFPSSSYQSSNYWVDPLFVADAGATSTPPPSGALFADTDIPTNADWNDPNAIEVGVRFRSDVDGVVTGVRFYKGPQNTGVHTGSLWSATGQLLASATFQNETGSGWQTVTFSQPVAVTAGTTYVASYSTSVGFYAVDLNAFSAGLDRPPLHVVPQGGGYRYGSGFPDSSAPHNFWVDVVWQ
jgi:N,N-dimethylformamidase beta subunit-like, C-terminal/Domain of unknown function (DUF4082)/Bacterial Ig-like domain/Bacterial Ig domain